MSLKKQLGIKSSILNNENRKFVHLHHCHYPSLKQPYIEIAKSLNDIIQYSAKQTTQPGNIARVTGLEMSDIRAQFSYIKHAPAQPIIVQCNLIFVSTCTKYTSKSFKFMLNPYLLTQHRSLNKFKTSKLYLSSYMNNTCVMCNLSCFVGLDVKLWVLQDQVHISVLKFMEPWYNLVLSVATRFHVTWCKLHQVPYIDAWTWFPSCCT